MQELRSGCGSAKCCTCTQGSRQSESLSRKSSTLAMIRIVNTRVRTQPRFRVSASFRSFVSSHADPDVIPLRLVGSVHALKLSKLSKKELVEEARLRHIVGFSKMDKSTLAQAIADRDVRFAAAAREATAREAKSPDSLSAASRVASTSSTRACATTRVSASGDSWRVYASKDPAVLTRMAMGEPDREKYIRDTCVALLF